MGKERDNSLSRHRSSGARQVVEIEIVIYSMLCFGLVRFYIDTVCMILDLEGYHISGPASAPQLHLTHPSCFLGREPSATEI